MEINHFSSFIEHLTKRWMSCYAFTPPILGCNDSEIEQLQIAQNVEKLPELYCEFMRQMGREDGGLGKLLDAYLTYTYALTFKSEQIDFSLPILKTYGLERGNFVFLSDNNNFLYFFDTVESSDDPIVYNLTPNIKIGEEFIKVNLGNLSGVLVDLVEQCFPDSDE
jgi:hypothetical protein